MEDSDHEMESAKYRKCLGRDRKLVNKRPVNVRYTALNSIDTISPTCIDNDQAKPRSAAGSR